MDRLAAAAWAVACANIIGMVLFLCFKGDYIETDNPKNIAKKE